MNPAYISLALSLFNSAAKLLLQLHADGGLTDEQLQQAATDENADTRNHATDFIARLKG